MTVANKTIPPTWLPAKQPVEVSDHTLTLEDRVSALEVATEENRGYLQRILSLLSKGADEMEVSTPQSLPPKAMLGSMSSTESSMKGVKTSCEVGKKKTEKRNDNFDTIDFRVVRPSQPRFFDKLHTGAIEEFNKLFQTSVVDDYQEKFEELKPFMLQHNAKLGEDYFVLSFISGLKEELRHMVKMHEPKHSHDAYRKAKLYELSLEIENKKFRSFYNTNSYENQGLMQKISKIPATIPQKEMSKSDVDDNVEEGKRQGLEREELEGDNEVFEISINAMSGSVGYMTIQIQGSKHGEPLSILLDSGSTHSFITERCAKEGLELLHTKPLVITMANGEQLHSTAKTNHLGWKV
ncbi:hypothetical protein GQ457_14G012040 [Hibiscus cannabinus]